MKKLFSILILMNVLLLLGCAGGDGDSANSPKRYARKSKKVLTEAEKAKYITPTIYHIADYSQAMSCADNGELSLRKTKNNIVKVSLCRKALKGCTMQGSCFITYEGKKTLINYHKKISGGVQFMLVDQSVCKHGLGDSSDPKQKFKLMCLDPFYSVAADTAIHPLGTVVYIPRVRGTKLPDGSTHDGYFVVRDSGGNIDGRGRFDFFTGDVSLNANNPFSDLGLGGESNFEYFVITGSDADAVRAKRAFPLLKK